MADRRPAQGHHAQVRTPLVTRQGAPVCDGGLPVRVRLRPAAQLDTAARASNTPPMVDPLVAALAQLVRDRWAAEQRERTARRARLKVVEETR